MKIIHETLLEGQIFLVQDAWIGLYYASTFDVDTGFTCVLQRIKTIPEKRRVGEFKQIEPHSPYRTPSRKHTM